MEEEKNEGSAASDGRLKSMVVRHSDQKENAGRERKRRKFHGEERKKIAPCRKEEDGRVMCSSHGHSLDDKNSILVPTFSRLQLFFYIYI